MTLKYKLDCTYRWTRVPTLHISPYKSESISLLERQQNFDPEVRAVPRTCFDPRLEVVEKHSVQVLHVECGLLWIEDYLVPTTAEVRQTVIV